MGIKHFIIVFSIAFSFSHRALAAPVSLKKNQIAKVKLDSRNVTCGYFKNRWQVAKKVGEKFEPKKSASDEQKEACSKLLKSGAVKSLSQFPSAATFVKAAETSTSLINVNSVSGIPPTLSELVDQGGDTYYWRTGVLSTITSGLPDNPTCAEMFGSPVDGSSSGWGGCNLTQSVGYSVGEIARGGTSLCYMKNAGSAEGAISGAINITAGSVAGGVKNLFSTPSGSDSRLIKIKAVGGEGESIIFINVAAASNNEREGNQYKFEYWACEEGSSPQEYEVTRITSGGQFKSQSIHTFGEGGIGESNISGFLKREGSKLAFDSAQERTAAFLGIPDQGGNFKSGITINGANQVFTKVFDNFGENVRKGYSAARFDGSGLNSLRFYEGAFKEEHSFGSFSGGIEFRDTTYLSAPNSEYVALLDAVSFSNDNFYNDTPSTPSIPSSARCNLSPDIEVELDMQSQFMTDVAAECEGERIDGEINFCSSNNINQAMAQYGSICNSQ